MSSRLLLALGALSAPAGAKTLTAENWDTATAGKTLFVAFIAPWCENCKKLKPTWEKLAKAYEGHASILLGTVDCVGKGSLICDSQRLSAFPTLKYGDPNALKLHKGGLSYKELEKFVTTKLKPPCGPANLEECDAEEVAKIEEYMVMTDNALTRLIKAEEKKINDPQRVFDLAIAQMNEEEFTPLQNEVGKSKMVLKTDSHWRMMLMREAQRHLASQHSEL